MEGGSGVSKRGVGERLIDLRVKESGPSFIPREEEEEEEEEVH